VRTATTSKVGGRRVTRKPAPFEKKPADKKAAATAPKGKEKRVWIDEFAPGDEKELARGPKPSSSLGVSDRVDVAELKFGIDEADASSSSEDEAATAGEEPQKRRGVWSFFSSLAGGSVLDREALEPAVAKFREHLRSKNVAFEIADKLCESVVASLIGKKLGTFQGVSQTVRTGVEEALTRILTPRRNIDVLRDIAAHKQGSQRPFSIVFIGVNGVGKSTNLAKVGSWLKKSGLKVMFAACDTFRSGAVEQLKVHASRLEIPLFEKGYGKDDTGIAQDALGQGLRYLSSSPSSSHNVSIDETCIRSIKKKHNP
jgi:signal recognition particle receptor subunit alpha